MHRERQPRDPRRAGELVSNVEAGGRRVLDLSRAAQTVVGLDEQVRLFVLAAIFVVSIRAAHQLDVAHRPSCVGGQVRIPHEAGRAVAEQVGHLHRREVLGGNRQVNGVGIAQAISAAVEVEPRTVAAEVDQVHRAAAVDVGQANALWVV